MSASGETKPEKFVKPLDLSSGNLATAWKVFKEQFNIYVIVKKLRELTVDEQIGHMLMAMGSDSVPVYNQFTFVPSDENKKKTLANCIKFFDAYFEPVKNVIFERSVFNKMTQQPGQSLHQFIVKLQVQSENCDYGDMRDDLVRDRIVVGVRDIELRKYLIDVPDLTLRLCIQKAKQYVSNQEHVAAMASTSGAQCPGKEEYAGNVDSVQRYKPKSSKQMTDTEENRSSNAKDQPCSKCGKWKHFGGRCPAERSSCNKCKRRGHWAKMCKGAQHVSALEENDDGVDSLFLGNYQ
ncbi:uncharacterized protein [Watersipora subatra]|uniref:uncharacterized protein n=1 Tax=Watersipora subatra TaxID=2589382 RepID=UPI00355BF5FD